MASSSIRRHPVWLGPRDFEEDEIGTIEIHEERLVVAVANTLTDFAPDDDPRRPSAEEVARIAAHLQDRLASDLAAWLRSYVKWERLIAGQSTEEFLQFLRTESWNPELLSVPAVQDQVEKVRETTTGADRDRLGRWIKGTQGRGRPPDHDPDRVEHIFKVAARHLRRLIDRLRTERKPRQAYDHVRDEFAAIGLRLERTGLLGEFLDEVESHALNKRGAWPRRGRWWNQLPLRAAFLDGFVARLLAKERRSTPSQMYKLGARSAHPTTKSVSGGQGV